MSLTRIFVVLGLGLKQSSPILTHAFRTVRPSTLYESHPSVFFGRFCSMLVSSEIKELRGSYLIRGKVLNHHIIINYVLGLEGSAMSKKRVPGSRRDIQDVQDAGSP